MIQGGIKTFISNIPKYGLARRFYSVKMPKAFVRCLESEDTLSLTFSYANADFGMRERQYNFNRVQTEAIETSTQRIAESLKRQAMKRRKKKKNKDGAVAEEPQEFQIDVNVIVGGIPCSGCCPCRDSLINGAQLKLGGTLYDIVVNTPTVQTLALPKNIMAGFPVHPKIEMEFVEKADCDFVWYRSTNVVVPMGKEQIESGNPSTKIDKPLLHPVKNWQQVGTEYCYQTSIEDVGRKLRVTCAPKLPNGDVGRVSEAISTVAVSAGPGRCPFDTRHEMTADLTGSGSFRFVSYNILADLYADSDFSRETLFPYCPPYALSIDYRKQLLLKEITGYNADIVCLQEVDIKVFKNDLSPALDAQGFTGVFNAKGGQVAEGQACFFRNSKFRLVDHHSVVLADAIQNSPLFSSLLETISQNEKLKDRLLRRTTALQVIHLESQEVPGQFLCIGNNHLYFHPDSDHIRLLQAGAGLLHLEQVVALAKSTNPGSDVALVVCGDFNSSPPFGVYQLMTTQFIPEDYADWSSNESEAVQNCSLNHPFQLESACGTPPFTNFTPGFADCIDYIFIDANQIAVEQIIPLPSEAEMKEHIGLPSVTLPSDHVALVCDLSWKKAKN